MTKNTMEVEESWEVVVTGARGEGVVEAKMGATAVVVASLEAEVLQ